MSVSVCLSVVSVVCCQVEVSAMRWSPVQRSPTECGASECDLKTSGMMRPWPSGSCCAKRRKKNASRLSLSLWFLDLCFSCHFTKSVLFFSLHLLVFTPSFIYLFHLCVVVTCSSR
jgi:hypothetical protein